MSASGGRPGGLIIVVIAVSVFGVLRLVSTAARSTPSYQPLGLPASYGSASNRYGLSPQTQQALDALQRSREVLNARGFYDVGADVGVEGTRTISLAPVYTGGCGAALAFALELGGDHPVLRVENKSATRFVGHALVKLSCVDRSGQLAMYDANIWGVRPRAVLRVPLSGARPACRSALSGRVAVDPGSFADFDTSEAGQRDAALSFIRYGVPSASRSRATAAFLSSYFNPRAGLALILRACRGDEHAARALAGEGEARRQFLLTSLEALQDPESMLRAFLAVPEQALPLVQKDQEGGHDVDQEIDAALTHVAGIAPHVPVVRSVERARTLDRMRPPSARARIDGRVESAAHAVIQALEQHTDDDTARRLLTVWTETRSEGQAAALLRVLERMPASLAPALAERLSYPSGKERRDFGELLRRGDARHEALRQALALQFGGAIPWEEFRERFILARSEELQRRITAIDASTSSREALLHARAAVEMGHPPTSLIPPLIAQARADALLGAYDLALPAVEEVLRIRPDHTIARSLREEWERQILERLFRGGLLYEGPAPTFRSFKPRFDVDEWYLPPSKEPFRLVTHGEALAFAGPSRSERMDLVLQRLQAAQDAGLEIEGSRVLEVRALAVKWAPRVFVTAAVLLGLVLLLLIARPGAIAVPLLAYGFVRTGAWLAAWGFRRSASPFAALVHSYALTVRAESAASGTASGERDVLLGKARGLEIFWPEASPNALRGRILYVEGDLPACIDAYQKALRETLPHWLRRRVQLDLARACFSRGDDAGAIEHGARAGGVGRLVEASARLRCGLPAAGPLWRLSIVGPQRHLARALLSHALIDRGRLSGARSVLAFTRSGDLRALYARARLHHVRGDASRATELYTRILARTPDHGGALLGLAMLRTDDERREALSSLPSDSSDASNCAQLVLAQGALQAGRPMDAVALLGIDPHTVPSARHARVLGVAYFKLARAVDAAAAFQRAASFVGSGSSSVGFENLNGALAADALERADAAGALQLLEGRSDPYGVRARAEWTRALRVLRANPAEGLGVPSFSEGRELGAPVGFCRAVSALVHGRTAEARRLLGEGDDAIARFVCLLLRDDAVDPAVLRDAGIRLREAFPSIAEVARLLEAARHFERGAITVGRDVLGDLPLSGDIDDPMTLCRAVVAARLGQPVELRGGLPGVFASAGKERFREAALALDGLPGTPARSLVPLRLGIGAADARRCLAERDTAGAHQALRSALAYVARAGFPSDTSPEGARVAHVRRALLELESPTWVRAAVANPASALALFERRSAATETLRSAIRHDRAILGMAALYADGTHRSGSALTKVIIAVDELMRSAATLAQYRLRMLELAGALPMVSSASLDENLRERMASQLASVLDVAVEELGTGGVREALQPWIDSDDRDGVFSRARGQLELKERDALDQALEVAAANSEAAHTLNEARDLWLELDAAVRCAMDRLAAFGASPGVLGDCADRAARAMDRLSIVFHSRFPRSGLPVEIVDRALALSRAEYLREHFHKNRRVMSM